MSDKKENIFQTLKKIEGMFPSSVHSYAFFKQHANYFKLHNFHQAGTTFSKRENDKTPSTHCGKFLRIIDFGGDSNQLQVIEFIRDIENEKLINEFGFDIAKDMKNFITFKQCDRLKENQLLIKEVGYKKAIASKHFHKFTSQEKENHKRRANSYKTAIDILKNLVGWTSDMDLNVEIYIPDVQAKVIKKPYNERYISRMQRALAINKNSPKDIVSGLISGLFRTCSESEIKIGIEKFSIGLNEYEVEDKDTGEFEKIHRLFITERDISGIPHGSFRYNREITPKGLIRGSSKRVLLGEHLIPNFSKNIPIIFSEGHSDVVVNTAKGLQCLTSGSSTTKIGKSICHLKGFDVHFYPDSDEAGYKGAIMKILEVANFNKTIKKEEDRITFKVKPWSLNIEKYFNDKGIECGGVFSFEDRIRWIHKEFEKGTFENLTVEEAISISDPLHWKPVTSAPLKKGFDFIDFHSKIRDEKTSEKAKIMINNLLNIYKV